MNPAGKVQSPHLWSAAEVDLLTGGRSSHAWQAHGIALKLDDIAPGDLFFAGPGDDLALAAHKGASAAAVKAGSAPGGAPLPLLEVADIYEALRALSVAARYRTHALVVALQGRALRDDLTALLGACAQVHQGGRHLSQTLASMPELCDFAFAGFSPQARPDVMIITDTRAALETGLLEGARAQTVILAASGDPHHAVLETYARRHGLKKVLYFGTREQDDIALLSVLSAANGSRLVLRVLGQDMTINLPSPPSSQAAMLLALGLMKIAGLPLDFLVRALACGAGGRQPARESLHLLHGAPGANHDTARGAELVYRVQNLIDWGARGRTLVLDGLGGGHGNITVPAASCSPPAALPRRLGMLSILYAGSKPAAQRKAGEVKGPEISPGVIAPGDLVVFQQDFGRGVSRFSRALRRVTSDLSFTLSPKNT